MSESSSLTNHEIVDAIARLCAQRASGTVFIVTPENRLARMVLQQGRIVCANLGRDNGVDVCKAIANLARAQFSFNDQLQLVTGNQDMPDTAELLQIMRSGNAGQKASGHSAEEGLGSHEVLRILIEETTEFIGPMARVICQEYMQQCPPRPGRAHIQQVLQRLEQDINDGAKAEQLRNRVGARLGW